MADKVVLVMAEADGPVGGALNLKGDEIRSTAATGAA
jgi:hypothetical protein